LGFTLIEMIGVLAIAAILVAIMTPVVVKRIHNAQIKQEAENLPVIAQAYTQYLLRERSTNPMTGTIPTNWANVAANELGLPIDRVLYSPGRVRRVFIAHPGMQFGTNIGLPYTQRTLGLSSPPVWARFLLISSQSKDLPPKFGNDYFRGTNVPSGDFINVWETPARTKPSRWTNWDGAAEDLALERIDLSPLFKRIIINNLDGTNAFFSIDQGPITPVPGLTAGMEAYYLEGTEIRFYDSSTNLQARELAAFDTHYEFVDGIWGNWAKDGRSSGVRRDLLLSLQRFLSMPDNPHTKHFVKKEHLVLTLYEFMWTYAKWANAKWDGQPRPFEPRGEWDGDEDEWFRHDHGHDDFQGSQRAHILVEIQANLLNWSKDLIGKTCECGDED
jgi:type II secretory pathway pseudopilin PulG